LQQKKLSNDQGTCETQKIRVLVKHTRLPPGYSTPGAVLLPNCRMEMYMRTALHKVPRNDTSALNME